MKPSIAQTLAALRLTARLTGQRCALAANGRFYFEVGGPWLLAVSPDDAGRFRVAACYGTREVATMWCRTEDSDRLADLVRSLRTEVKALV
jgi:hypothetical protein